MLKQIAMVYHVHRMMLRKSSPVLCAPSEQCNHYVLIRPRSLLFDFSYSFELKKNTTFLCSLHLSVLDLTFNCFTNFKRKFLKDPFYNNEAESNYQCLPNNQSRIMFYLKFME